MRYEIEKNVPLPVVPQKDKRGAWNSKYPWYEMDIGDSFFVPGKTRNLISSLAKTAGNRMGFAFALHDLDGGVRVWRIADPPKPAKQAPRPLVDEGMELDDDDLPID